MFGNGNIAEIAREQVQVRRSESEFDQLSDSSDDEMRGYIPSSICKVKKLSSNPKLEPYRRWWVEMRQKENQKVSLKLYRHLGHNS